MNNEPVAWINRDEKEGWLNWDKNTAMPINIPLYTHPADAEKVKENMDKVLKQNERLIGALANARITFDAEIEKKNTMLKMWEATHPAKTLTDEEILNVAFCSEVNTVSIENDWDGTVIDFARAILQRASEK